MTTVRRHYSERSWIEGAAEKQLDEVAALPGVVSVSGFPDLHPGKNGPVGMAATSGRLYPHLVGNDLGCGFGLFDLGIPARKLRADKAEERMRSIEFVAPDDVGERLEAAGLPGDLFAGALGSIGGGNHFAELTCVEEAFTGDYDLGANVLLLVHTGSRSLGTDVWEYALSRTSDIMAGLDPASELGSDWFARHDQAVKWAALNRRLIAESVAEALRGECEAICDVPHNLVVSDDTVHRHYKGASRLCPGEFAPIAGSRDSLSHFVRATGVENSDFGIAHGSGRKRDRSSMHGRNGLKRSEREAFQRNQWGGRVICDDNALLVEEQASAYKNPRHVLDDLASAGLVEPICSLRPIVTYKKASETDAASQRRAEDKRKGRERNARH
ncbi:RNA ligase RtcB family protein [Pararhizobium sp. BT-229]|uniref:RNA ligase RtcB family protein n=1 Tax=Pararhizobium sp. BT-229 TaxID=2986923 RepID=UPI0021F7AE34|nr:RNA ligase RtcB family protein [Pararhizobium sp. BT-229]MCV9963842.1 RNA ligase RtcB family protein [Pararhizobium sp. BT-229]